MKRFDTIKIWLGNLHAYTCGELEGEWLTLPMREEDLNSKISQICSKDGIEHEYYIADWECDIDGLVHEYSNLKELNEIAEELEKLTEHDFDRLQYLIEEESYKFAEAIEKLEDVEYYKDSSIKDVAYQLVEDGCIKIENYIDYEAIARDLGFDGYTQSNGSVFRLSH
jgi:antirestriction protein